MDQLNIGITIMVQGTMYQGIVNLQPIIQQPNNQPEPAPEPEPEPTPAPQQVQPQTQRQRRNIQMIQAAQDALEEKRNRRREGNKLSQRAHRERKKAALIAQAQTQNQ